MRTTPLSFVLLLAPVLGCDGPIDAQPVDAVPDTQTVDSESEHVDLLDLSDAALLRFETGEGLGADAPAQERGVFDYTNFAAGAASLVTMGAVSGLVTGSPASVLGATYLQGTPTYVAWNQIEYTHTVIIGDYSYEAVLTTTFQWSAWELDMVVDMVGPNEQVLGWNWMTGTVGLLGNEGEWTLRNPDGFAFAEVEYQVDGDGVFVVIDSADGGSLTSDVAADGVAMTLVEPDGDVTATIWNLETLAGSLVTPYYAGGAAACWDAALMNTPCTP